jgi:xanthine dehydrogenase accessory factor
MSELLPVLETLLADADAGRPVALCVVVRTQGPTPQVPGAAMVVRSDGSTCGTLGGGCVEAEVRTRAFQHMRQTTAAQLDFDLDHDYGWGNGLICGGQMTVAVWPVTPQTDLAPIRAAVAAARQRQPASIALESQHDGRQLTYRVHLEVPPTLLIAGAGHVGQAVARLAVELDFHPIVIDDRAELAAPQRFPAGVECRVGDIATILRDYPLDAGCYVVIVTRGHRHDADALTAVIRRAAAYVGMIGSRRKSAIILQQMADTGATPEQLQRVHTPIGLPIRAITVNEIAVSILAELIQVRRAQTPCLVEGPLDNAAAKA